ncbi:isoprenoid synthase domain-containing protein [Dactylonectria estremocensis]|uniref:Isoprenoid synthase domain-containing protein n=1 Tax=Dactylonectria estremocensis TaxID=1079267 RepID=A0A9P9F1F1_9HYPO|nr:isoprenoid synthase domain-containing protein [Dactylonectria estremocensis]
MIPNQTPEPFSIAHMLSMPITETEKMPSNPLASPTIIPRRTSSSAATVTAPPPKSIHRPVPEGEWISPKERPAKPAGPGLGMMQPPNQPPNADRYAYDDLNFTAQRSWTDDKEKVVRGPFDYVISHPGKDFRAQLIGAFNTWLNVPKDSLEIITRVVGMLHESSLLVDDVQDSSELRRGFPVAHNIFGVAQTINSANYIYFTALQELQKLNNPETIVMFAEELVNLHRGQGMDLFWRDTLTCPTEEDYLEMVGNKTGGLFRLGIKLMQAESASKINCVPLVNLVGLIFQIRDDFMNLSSKEYSNNKGMCEDLTEGKFSFPVIHSIRSNPSNLQLVNILKQKTSDTQVKRYAVAYMESTGSFEYTKSVITILIKRARKLAEEIDGGQGLTKGIHKILDKMVVA